MKCYLIRDLLPLYIEGDCSPETARAVKEHLHNCDRCRSDFELMAPPLEMETWTNGGLIEEEGNVLNEQEQQVDTNEFLQNYYGKLILKGAGIFLFVYVLVVVGALIMR
ncbi:MAG: zf-HC2 domain-containing protein [Bacillus sp. (in: Bacteria)]|nr:zf-HC2 domain-containing protein [Bacillus sp. (in: firmicutes)]